MIRSVLIPVEFTEECELIVRFVTGLRALGVERVVLGHVVEDSGMEGPVIAHTVDEARDSLHGLAKPLVDEGFDVEFRVGTGDPSHEIIALAAENRADSIVAGTHAQTALSRLLRGSVSEELVKNAERPTMLVRFDLLRNASDPAELARAFGNAVVLPTDFSASSMRAALWTLNLPKEALGRLLLLHVLESLLEGEQLEIRERDAESRLGTYCELASDSGITARCVVRQGDAIQEVLREMHEIRATGVVTGSRGRGALGEAMLGSVSASIVRQASCPVMIVP